MQACPLPRLSTPALFDGFPFTPRADFRLTLSTLKPKVPAIRMFALSWNFLFRHGLRIALRSVEVNNLFGAARGAGQDAAAAQINRPPCL